jgi:hypothetical protein
VALYGVRVGLPASERIGPVAQWLEPTAHNGLVGGSNPPGPTTAVHPAGRDKSRILTVAIGGQTMVEREAANR